MSKNLIIYSIFLFLIACDGGNLNDSEQPPDEENKNCFFSNWSDSDFKELNELIQSVAALDTNLEEEKFIRLGILAKTRSENTKTSDLGINEWELLHKHISFNNKLIKIGNSSIKQLKTCK